MESVCRDKRIKKKVVGDDVVYEYKEPVKKVNTDRLGLKDYYPREDYEMPFPEWDLSYMFLKPAELKQYKADAKGIPVYMMRKGRRKS